MGEESGDSTGPGSKFLVTGVCRRRGGQGAVVFQGWEMVRIVEDPLGGLKKYLPTSTERYHCSNNQYFSTGANHFISALGS